MDQIEFSDFAKVDFRVGEILEAEKVEASNKLIKMLVDFGEAGKKTVFSGIFQWYTPEELVNKKTIFVINIKPKAILGEESGAMIFAAEDEATKVISLLFLDKEVKNGSKVY